ncbi:methylated-DNA--[protein]-cysteine S-methyltransferase [Kaistia geumhonensis]|uniref:Methylated-DNA-[protein]-cysteine S-methyltransferase n=1 Tax=Kaistia geumhonensis TaxID=410839 RepID=A0ABU0M0X4_9HYPH|nr:methylated-DNA--[protein]-cysteine S-methyltransferase [Kaistia geumhonensis]MCX5480180.1 methylated-DNA--[protein]-cysteine S-methyltransferase [Kaistia geumhonensis]MDQ0514591.1 methylated-DNA-[protein]-cysteine S-methyltransferase [Kaistia geumhonensis]
MTIRFALFDTPLGRSAIVWGADGIRRTLLPERDPATTLQLLRRMFPEAEPGEPTGAVAAAAAGMRSLLEGGREDLREAPLDMSGLDRFSVAVYQALRTVGPGQTITYGALAERAGAPGAARAVGVALGRNPFPIIVPCHRVLAAGGRTGGFSAPGGVVTKLEILTRERARVGETAGLFDDLGLPLSLRRR